MNRKTNHSTKKRKQTSGTGQKRNSASQDKSPRKKPAMRASKAKTATASPEPTSGQWTFLTNHSHVLILLARNPSMVLREVAFEIGITERAVQRIITDLEQAGFVEREKVGRQNHYRLITDRALRHPIENHCTIGDLIDLVNQSTGD